ncbi:hypothetical protein MTBBW1_2030043 [Desulfamplus magnetovallimortis]|uniref:Uncharacterized protein n=1 Tax=Desulfamplus magnetovallimortis TaxID=1246637 RepID=A0A1W1HBY3_9BACT|nr:hypothetical protein [Desulfamplus magnetovallimortis]SLM29953.1 hypothetical protein MTBBW1_2030043 [Desulfamplus magnetovallimortis]
MSKKRFATCLITGKLALGTVVYQPTTYASSLDTLKNDSVSNQYVTSSPCLSNLFTTNLNLHELPGEAIEVNNCSEDDAGAYGPSATNSAIINMPGTNCTFGTPDSLSVIVTGVKPADHVFLCISDSNNDPAALSETNGQLGLGIENFEIVAYYKMSQATIPYSGSASIPPISVNSSQTQNPIKIEFALSDLNSFIGDQFYLQLITFPDGQIGQWEYCRSSEVDTISIEEKNCCSGPYC